MWSLHLWTSPAVSVSVNIQCSGKVKARQVIRNTEVKVFKNWIVANCKSNNNNLPPCCNCCVCVALCMHGAEWMSRSTAGKSSELFFKTRPPVGEDFFSLHVIPNTSYDVRISLTHANCGTDYFVSTLRWHYSILAILVWDYCTLLASKSSASHVSLYVGTGKFPADILYSLSAVLYLVYISPRHGRYNNLAWQFCDAGF